MTETNSEPIIDLTELVSRGKQGPEELCPPDGKKDESLSPHTESPGCAEDQAAPSPLVRGLLPGLVDKIAGLSHDIDVLRDRMEKISLRQNRLDEAHRRNASQPGAQADAGFVTEEELKPLAERIAALEERDRDSETKTRDEDSAPITALDMRLSSCEEQLALCATRSELEETCRNLLERHFSQSGTDSTTMNTTETGPDGARAHDQALDDLVGDLVARHLQACAPHAPSDGDMTARLDELERDLAGAEEGLADLSRKLTDGLETIHSALDSLESSLSLALEQEKEDAQGVERTTAGLATLSARVNKLEEMLLAEQGQREDLARALAQKTQDDKAWKEAWTEGQGSADCEIRDTLASLEARLEALGQRTASGEGGDAQADEAQASDGERVDSQAEEIRQLRTDQDRTRSELEERCAYLASRMSALEAQLGEENLERAAARACLKVLREEIAGIVRGGKA